MDARRERNAARPHAADHAVRDETPRLHRRVASSDSAFASQPRWLSVNQIRRQQRMRREAVLAAMASGELPFEQRGRIRYARECDVIAWEQKRLTRAPDSARLAIHRDLLKYL